MFMFELVGVNMGGGYLCKSEYQQPCAALSRVCEQVHLYAEICAFTCKSPSDTAQVHSAAACSYTEELGPRAQTILHRPHHYSTRFGLPLSRVRLPR